MKIEIDDGKIFLKGEGGQEPYVLMKKPEVDDYSNLTVRPLVVNYHLKTETIWERSCQSTQELQDNCGGFSYFACYGLLFEQLYPVLLSSSQSKNIICYGMDGEPQTAAVFQHFMTFLQKDSSFLVLPENPFVFSALLNQSCHAAIVCLDKCRDVRILYDAISKIRDGGKLFFYTNKETVPREASALINCALKRSFGSGAVYSLTVDENIRAFAYEQNSESGIMPSVGSLLTMLEQLKELTAVMDKGCTLGVYPSAIELLWRLEEILLALYDVLENPKLPLYANALKESLMDCYIGAANRLDIETYFSRMRQETAIFYEAMENEFGKP